MDDPAENAEGWAPKWDKKVAESALGKVVLVGVTHLAADGVTVTGRVQYHGVIVEADEKRGVSIDRRGEGAGERVWLPPDLSLFTPAPPGEYRLRATGEIVVNPDFISQWTVRDPIKH